MGDIVKYAAQSAITHHKRFLRQAVALRASGASGKRSIIEGYIASTTADKNNSITTVLDVPGSIVVFHRSEPSKSGGWAVYAVGTRDSFDSRVGITDGPYSASDDPAAPTKDLFWSFGFDPESTAWEDAAVPPFPTGDHIYKREKLLNSRTKVYPSTAFKLGPTNPTLGASAIFSEARVIGHSTASTPGLVFSREFISSLTGGYEPARNVNPGGTGYTGAVYAGFEYQGDTPVITYHQRTALVVIPVVDNIETGLAAGVTHWGKSGVLFMMYDVPGPITDPENAPVLRWSRLWLPDEHSVDFFHNGPWLSYPSPGHSPPFIFPVIEGLWDDWWGDWETAGYPTPAGGSRPNWTDAISVAWHVDRFVVNLRCCALNGVFNRVGGPGEDDYWTAGGSAHVRFEIEPTEGSASFTVTEVEHEIWDAPERHPYADPADTPYAEWVVGVLDTDTLHCSNPVCTFVDDNRLFEVVWRMEGDRHDTSPGGRGQVALVETGRIEITVTEPGEDTQVHVVNFQDLGYGVVGPAITDAPGVEVLASPTSSYKMRALESQFLVLSRNELAFLARESWFFAFSAPAEPAHLIVLNLETGVATWRSETPARMPNDLTHTEPAHMDVVQQAVINAEGDTVLEAVLIVTGDEVTASAYISRDSGFTWSEYVTDINDDIPQRAVYYIGNPLGGGTRSGHAVL